jgi:hypothetical protein
VSGLRRALLTIAASALLLGLVTIPVVLTSNHAGSRGLFLASQLVIGWSFVGTGLFMWWRRPENRLGALMTAVGFTWLLGSLLAANDGYVFFAGELLAALPYAFLVQMLLSFPDGRLHSRLEQLIVAAAWFDVTVMQWAPLPFLQFRRAQGCEGCPANPLLLSDHKSISDAFGKGQAAIALVLVLALVVALVRRSRALGPTHRRALNPVIWTGALALVVLVGALIAKLGGAQSPGIQTVYLAGLPLLAAVPYAFLAGLMQSRFTRAAAVTELVAQLSAGADRRHGLREALADAFGDPSLILAYWLPERERYVDANGHQVELPRAGAVVPGLRSRVTVSRWRRSFTMLPSPMSGDCSRRPARPRAWRSRTSGCTPSCARGSKSSSAPGSGSSRPASRSGASSSATSTTEPSNGSSRSR